MFEGAEIARAIVLAFLIVSYLIAEYAKDSIEKQRFEYLHLHGEFPDLNRLDKEDALIRSMDFRRRVLLLAYLILDAAAGVL